MDSEFLPKYIFHLEQYASGSMTVGISKNEMPDLRASTDNPKAMKAKGVRFYQSYGYRVDGIIFL